MLTPIEKVEAEVARDPIVRRVAEVMPAPAEKFTGTPTEFMSEVFRDPDVNMSYRLAACNVLIRFCPETDPISQMTANERRSRIRELLRGTDVAELLAGDEGIDVDMAPDDADR